jgi:GNAT superfamily N-acetyltransferase
MTLVVERRLGGCGDVCRAILSELPEWFGIPEANAGYANDAETLPTWLALLDGAPAGLLIAKTRFPESAEIWLTATRRALRRHGIGRALVAAAEHEARAAGAQYFSVKTLGPSEVYAPYEETRAFYRAVGFAPLEEFKTLWGPENPALLMVKALR